MSLKPGTHLGPYEILSAIGAGGMGEVYKARDTRLNRIVAIKVLPEHLAVNADLRERFRREAETIANLKHPHICVLYDIGHQDGMDFLVMEYLGGETLAQRLTKGPLPLDQVLRYGIEIADALDKAHRQGVTHRDLKPGNVMLTKEGTKLLDFGLAKLRQDASPTTPLSQLPTAKTALTEHGTILGALQYMAPEQVEGKTDEIDARTDMFAFGTVIYEMATGKKAFEGKSQASLMAKILEHDPPPMSSLQPMTPPALDRTVEKCLAREREDRWQSAKDLHDELKWIAEGGSKAEKATGTQAKPAAKGWRRAVPWAATFLAGVIFAILALWNSRPSLPPVVQAPAHMVIALPPGDRLAAQNYPPLALSPNGNYLVYVAIHDGVQQLFLRPMDNREAKPLPGTDGAESPFFSPDGQWIGFFASGKLKKLSITGGAPQTLCDSGSNGGASWGADDTIVFTPSANSGLLRVSAVGGKPQVLTTPDHAKGELSHRWPQFLPGGKALLFTVFTGTGWDENGIAVLRFDTGERRVVVHGGYAGRFVPTGHLVYYRAGSLLAAPLDLARLEVTSNSPVTIVEGVTQSTGTFGAEYTFSEAGSLAYVPASPRQFERRLVWVDRKGAVEPIPAPPRAYEDGSLALSPDGQRVAISIL